MRVFVRAIVGVVVAGLLGFGAFATPASADDAGDEWEFVAAINAERAAAGKGALTPLASLRDVARAQSVRMGQQSRLYHNPSLVPDVAAAAPDWQRAGENVGQGGGVPALHAAFMTSPAHRANVLGDFNYVGIGVVRAGGFLWVTEVFLKAPPGKPALPPPSAAPAAPPAPPQGAAGAAAAPPAPPLPVDRITAGATDGGTPLAVSRRFPDAGSDAVVVGRDDVFADALAGSALAAAGSGPVLLSRPRTPDAAVVSEARRVLKPGGVVYLLGGTSALSDAVEQSFVDAGLRVTRVAGEDRYATAVAVARLLNTNPGEVLVVSGTEFADAVVAGVAAGLRRAPIVLASPSGLPPATRKYLDTVPAARRTVVGGRAAVPEAAFVAAGAGTRIAGADRYETSVKLAELFFPGTAQLSFATGSQFQDALAGAAWSARAAIPLVLVGQAPAPATQAFVRARAAALESSIVYGGADVVPDAAITQLFA